MGGFVFVMLPQNQGQIVPYVTVTGHCSMSHAMKVVDKLASYVYKFSLMTFYPHYGKTYCLCK